MRLPALLCASLLSLVSSCVQAQNTFWVTSTAASGPGTLRAAVESMQSNGTTQTIRFQVNPNAQITLDAPLPALVGAQVEIIGSDSAGLLIDGAQFAMFTYSGQALTIRDLTLANGHNTGGGCVQVNTSIQAIIENVRFIGCSTRGSAASGSGGGAIRSFGSLLVRRSRFDNNSATDGGIDSLALGGGAILSGGGGVLIEDSHFTGNQTVHTVRPAGGCFDSSGGAVSLGLDTLTGIVRRSVFRDNRTRCGASNGPISGQAGALFVIGPGSGSAPTMLIDSSYFDDNKASNAAGIFARGVRLVIENSSFIRNRSGGAGAVFLSTGFGSAPPPPVLVLRSSTFWQNGTTSPTFGAHITLISSATVSEMRNTVFAPAASGQNCMPASFNLSSGGPTFTTDTSCFGFLGPDTVTGQFAATNTFELIDPVTTGTELPALGPGDGSVLIDNGTNTGCPALDARGASRPYDGDANPGAVCDVGAVEYRADALFANGFES